MIDHKLAERIVRFLNGLIDYDREAIEALVNARVPCNSKLALHPTVQVRTHLSDICCDTHEVGLMGIINGLCGASEQDEGYVYAIYDGTTKALIRFQVGPTEGTTT